jgi:hypothetical protein
MPSRLNAGLQMGIRGVETYNNQDGIAILFNHFFVYLIKLSSAR